MFDKLRPLNPYLRRYWKSLAWGGASIVLYNVVKVLLPLVVGQAVDDMRHGVTQQKIVYSVLALLLIAAVSAVFLYITRQVIIGASREIEFDLRNDLFANLSRQQPSYFHTHRTGDIMARTTNDLNAVRQLLGPAIMYSANTIVYMASALPFMYRISPKLTFFAFVPLPAASVLVQVAGNRINRRFERIQAMYSDVSAKTQENFSGARLIRAFAQEEAEIASFETSNREYMKRSLHLVSLMAMLWPSLEFLLGLAPFITLLVGGHEVVAHRISVGDFTAFNVYMVQLIFPLIAVGWVVNLFQRGTASVVRIDEILKQEPEIADDPALLKGLSIATDEIEKKSHPEQSAKHVVEEPALSLPKGPAVGAPTISIQGDIQFHNLTFAYPDGPNVLSNIKLHIPAGTSLAVVGPTGSGKSTLVNLIPRLLDATPGSVFIDETPIRQIPLQTLRENIGFVPQETFLFSDTIRHNISFGVPEADDSQIKSAATTAHIATEILEFPAGFDTKVGERGLTLSGGQKQRTAIARAVIRNPRILILDDALASVDTYTEEQILSGLRQVMQGRTTIFISHRISTARNADQIAVLVGGSIVERGTHDELIALNGYYTGLYEKQRLEEEIAVTT